MIQLKTIIDIVDNTGAQRGECLKVLNKSLKKKGSLNNLILVSIKNTKNKNKSKKIYKKELHKAIIIRVKKKKIRYDGSSIKFSSNAAILIKKETQKDVFIPIGTRIFGPVSNELRLKLTTNSKILSISSKTI